MGMLAMMGPVILVGVLSEQGTSVCQKGQQTWLNPRLEVGFQRVVFDTPPAKALWGHAVVVKGTPSDPPRQAPLPDDDGTCPPMQMRSDWIPGMHGIRLRREDSPPRGFYTAPGAEPFTGLSAKVGEAVEISLKNTLGVPLKGVRLRLHYEGCYGKPGAPDETRPVGDVAPGATGTATFPLRIMRQIGRGMEHVPHSIQVVAEGVVMDLDLPVAQLGVKVPCESRKR